MTHIDALKELYNDPEWDAFLDHLASATPARVTHKDGRWFLEGYGELVEGRTALGGVAWHLRADG